MASNNTEFYRGKRRKKGPSLIITIIVLAVVAFVVLLFYGLQKYIVITNDGLRLEIPMLMEDAPAQTDDEGNVTHSFEPVEAELEIGDTIDFTVWRDGKTFDVSVELMDGAEISDG